MWFLRLFPAFMILFPLAYTLFAGKHPDRANDDAAQRMRRLVVVTAVLLAVHVAVMVLLGNDPDRFRVLRQAWPVGFGTGMFFVVWFGFAMPALQARQPGYRPMPHAGSPEPVRSASLTPRDTNIPLPRGAWVLGWTLFGLCVGATVWAIVKGAPALLLLGWGFWLGMGVFGTRASQVEPEPMDASGSPELAEAWASLRRFKAWSFWALGLVGSMGFACVAVLTVFRPDIAGISGGVLGTAAGVTGGIIGTMGSVRRARVNALLQELGAREAERPAG